MVPDDYEWPPMRPIDALMTSCAQVDIPHRLLGHVHHVLLRARVVPRGRPSRAPCPHVSAAAVHGTEGEGRHSSAEASLGHESHDARGR